MHWCLGRLWYNVNVWRKIGMVEHYPAMLSLASVYSIKSWTSVSDCFGSSAGLVPGLFKGSCVDICSFLQRSVLSSLPTHRVECLGKQFHNESEGGRGREREREEERGRGRERKRERERRLKRQIFIETLRNLKTTGLCVKDRQLALGVQPAVGNTRYDREREWNMERRGLQGDCVGGGGERERVRDERRSS